MKYEIGRSESFSKTISESDVYLFAGVTGDFNSVHINEEYAKNTVFEGRIAHGLLIAGLISTVLGTKFPGCGTVYLEQNLKFLAPAKIGDTLTAYVEVAEHLNGRKGIIKLSTNIFNQNRIMVVSGTAVVKVPEGKLT